MTKQALDNKSEADNGGNGADNASSVNSANSANSSDASDALERIKRKNHPRVESRDASLTATTPDTSMSGMLQSQMCESGEKLENPKAEVVKQDLETKQSTLRLEAKLNNRFQALCREQGICREVLIEAMFEYCETNHEVLNAVLIEARKKNDYRQEIANGRRAKSMMEKFGGLND